MQKHLLLTFFSDNNKNFSFLFQLISSCSIPGADPIKLFFLRFPIFALTVLLHIEKNHCYGNKMSLLCSEKRRNSLLADNFFVREEKKFYRIGYLTINLKLIGHALQNICASEVNTFFFVFLTCAARIPKQKLLPNKS